ncbi:Uu.00g114790.m01.CDS01 [Anthostomella pinea]|uniref:Uu.00g114790.m01.CDS01 n=1 Tax=Anthostomella pinea TaxID=933095 RepID=A0AAI8VFR6_9PEZI|nr:Uu.00g114790.m01.CDS01 [Anthostomella pinea]
MADLGHGETIIIRGGLQHASQRPQSHYDIAEDPYQPPDPTGSQDIERSDSPRPPLRPEPPSVAPVPRTDDTRGEPFRFRSFEPPRADSRSPDVLSTPPVASIAHLSSTRKRAFEDFSAHDFDHHTAIASLDDLVLPKLSSSIPHLDPTTSCELAYEELTGAEQAEEDIDAAEQVEAGIIVADMDSVTDAGYESDTATTASTSIASSMWDYSYENGRRYHKFREGRYNFPNDDVEQQREDMKHAMVKMLTQKLHFAPIGLNPHEVAFCSIHFAAEHHRQTLTIVFAVGDAYPSANVLGIDLSPIQPDWVPPNVRFMVDDVESPWLHPRNHFDYIHSRHTVMAIKDWDRLLRRAHEHLRPGGWVEMQEINHFPMSTNDSMTPDHPVAQYWRLINEGLAELGVNFKFASGGRIAELMRQCGYINVTEQIFHVPIGTWPRNKKLKSVGLYWKTILLDGVQAIALGPMTRGLRWRVEQVETFLATVRKAYHDNSCLMFMPLVCVYGQKPEHNY